jgi:hypothetical protein
VSIRTDLGIFENAGALRDFVRNAIKAAIAAVFRAGNGIEVGGHN